VIETPATTPEVPPDAPVRSNRVWRMVLIVVTFQLVIIAAGMFFFTAMGFANDPTGGCGGG
jgi:magnesium-transporting ATPase (P-type)